MRVLYLSFSRQSSFHGFTAKEISGCPWVDAQIAEMAKLPDFSVGLGIPVSTGGFNKIHDKNVTVYLLPNPEEKKYSFRKVYNRLAHKPENININHYALQTVDDFEPDLIQVFGSENPFGLIASETVYPVIIHIQGFLTVCREKWFSGMTKWEQVKYTGLKNLLLMRGMFNEYFTFSKRAQREINILKSGKYFIGHTDFDRRFLSLVSRGSIYFHCDEFIRSDFFERKWDVSPGNVIRIISILKAVPYKGIELLVRTILVLREQTSLKIELNVCGVSAMDEIVRAVQKKLNTNFEALNIRFLGTLGTNELIEQLLRSNLYVNPSHIENSPNSVCEAMVLGMPVISTDVGGVNSLITDSQDGILVQEGEPYSMAGAILDLINNYDFARSIGKAARNRALLRHNALKLREQLLGIYKEILTDNDNRKL